jgi:misacylated tRNA(Ala) deacylase
VIATQSLFYETPYLREAEGIVLGRTHEGGLIMDRTIFYPAGGGQPGDSGRLVWAGGDITIATTIRGEGGAPILLPAEPAPLPPLGIKLRQIIDWDRRHRLMRVHTALHLLSVVMPYRVLDGQIGGLKGRLDFQIAEFKDDLPSIENALNRLIGLGLDVTTRWVTAAELNARPDLIKPIYARPKVVSGHSPVRIVHIGAAEAPIDLQPCGGTHVANTSEIGQVRLGKAENMGGDTQRISLSLA